jgi:hypothetical protein
MTMTGVTVPFQFFVDIESVEGFWEGWDAALHGTTCDAIGDDPHGRSGTVGFVLARKLAQAAQEALVGLDQPAAAKLQPFVQYENPDAAAIRKRTRRGKNP